MSTGITDWEILTVDGRVIDIRIKGDPVYGSDAWEALGEMVWAAIAEEMKRRATPAVPSA